VHREVVPKKLKLPAEVSAAEVENHLKTARDPFAINILRALQSALAGDSAEACSRNVGKQRRWFFELLKRIHQRGLEACLSRRHGGGMATTIPVGVLKQMETKFRAGKTSRWISAWLQGQKIYMSVDGVNYWKRKLGFVRTRGTAKAIARGHLN